MLPHPLIVCLTFQFIVLIQNFRRDTPPGVSVPIKVYNSYHLFFFSEEKRTKSAHRVPILFRTPQEGCPYEI